MAAQREEKRENKARIKALRTFRAQIAERRVWAFRRVATSNSKGVERWECPAQAGKLICANCPLSATYPTDRPTVVDPPDLSIVPKKINNELNRELLCCRNRTVSIPLEANRKLRQVYYWGSQEWITAYNRRTYVEGWFGTLKNTDMARVVRGFCRVVGLVKTGLLLACAAAATNINRLRSWAAQAGNTNIELAQPDPPSYGFEEVGADGLILTKPNAPPGT